MHAWALVYYYMHTWSLGYYYMQAWSLGYYYMPGCYCVATVYLQKVLAGMLLTPPQVENKYSPVLITLSS